LDLEFDTGTIMPPTDFVFCCESPRLLTTEMVTGTVTLEVFDPCENKVLTPSVKKTTEIRSSDVSVAALVNQPIFGIPTTTDSVQCPITNIEIVDDKSNIVSSSLFTMEANGQLNWTGAEGLETKLRYQVTTSSGF
jgi:hypothetical protein